MIKKVLKWLLKMIVGFVWIAFGAVNISAGMALLGIKKNS